jgi:hypothetical protein
MAPRLTASFEIDGVQVPASECDWQLIAPCGCVFGMSVVERDGEFLGTEEQAWREFEPRARDRKRMTSKGYTVRIARRGDGVDAFLAGCTHRSGGDQ